MLTNGNNQRPRAVHFLLPGTGKRSGCHMWVNGSGPHEAIDFVWIELRVDTLNDPMEYRITLNGRTRASPPHASFYVAVRCLLRLLWASSFCTYIYVSKTIYSDF